MEAEGVSSRARAVFMAFGTKGDVYPIAAVAAALASDQEQYDVAFITHFAHEDLSKDLESKNVSWHPISSPPVLSAQEGNFVAGAKEVDFSKHKKDIQANHRKECLSAIERIFGDCPSSKGDFIVINFFALEGWNLAELFRVRCVIATPYVVPYSSPASFERRFRHEHPILYKYLREAPMNKVDWRDVLHWMWPLFTEDWGSWRQECLYLSPLPLTDPVTCLPLWSKREQSPIVLYGFSKNVVECPGYWPSNAHVCGFWFLPEEWQFSCLDCRQLFSLYPLSDVTRNIRLCPSHVDLQLFLEKPSSHPPLFLGLSSIGSMGFLQNPSTFLLVLQTVLAKIDYRIILFSAGYKPLDASILFHSSTSTSHDEMHNSGKEGTHLFDGRLFCFSGSVPYRWLFPKCAVIIHHGGSGSTAAALHAGKPQIICPFILDQFYWAERMSWLGVAPEPLQKKILIPDDNSSAKSIEQAAEVLRKAIELATSTQIKSRASEMANTISSENGIEEALKILKEKVIGKR